jgi:hypothetical protein
MPLPSYEYSNRPLCGAKCKRTGLPCLNMPMKISKAGRCRMHGGRLGVRKVLRGADHPQYRNKGETRQEREERSKKSAALLYLRDIGDHVNLFNGTKTRGRRPKNYMPLDISDPEQLAIALIKAFKN